MIKTDISDAARKFSTPHKVITIILGYTKLIYYVSWIQPGLSLYTSNKNLNHMILILSCDANMAQE